MTTKDTFKTSYRILKNHNLIIESLEGEMTLDALLLHKKHLLSDPDYNPKFDVLTEMAHVVYDMPDIDKLRFLSKTKGRGLFSEAKNAALIATDDHELNNKPFNKLSKFLSISHFYSRSLEEVLDYLEHPDLIALVEGFLLNKRKNQDLEWIVPSKKESHLFEKMSLSIQLFIEQLFPSRKKFGPFEAKYKIYKDRRLVIEYYTGVMTMEALAAHLQILAADPDYSLDYDIFYDVRTVQYELSMAELANFIQVVRDTATVGNRRSASLILTHNHFIYNQIIHQAFIGTTVEHRLSKSIDEVLVFLEQLDFKDEIEAFLKEQQLYFAKKRKK